MFKCLLIIHIFLYRNIKNKLYRCDENKSYIIILAIVQAFFTKILFKSFTIKVFLLIYNIIHSFIYVHFARYIHFNKPHDRNRLHFYGSEFKKRYRQNIENIRIYLHQACTTG